MAINVNWSNDPVLAGLLASATGRAQYEQDQAAIARQQAQQDVTNQRADAALAAQLAQQGSQDQRAAADLAERRRQFDRGLNAKDYDNAAQRRLQRDQWGAQAQLADQQAAWRQAAIDSDAQLALLKNAQNIAADQYEGGLEMQKLQQEQEFDVTTAATEEINSEASKVLAEYRKKKLDPAGQRELHRLSAEWRALQGGLGRSVRPQAWNQLAGQWFENFETANLDQYEVEEPTIEQTIQESTWVDPASGERLGLDRNGAPRKVADAPPMPLTQEVVDANTFNIGGVPTFIHPQTQKEFTPTAPKAEKPEPKLTVSDHARIRKEMTDELRDEWEADHNSEVDEKTGEAKPATKSFRQYRDENWERKKKEWNEDRGDPETKTLVPSEPEEAPAGPTGKGTEADPLVLPEDMSDEEILALWPTLADGTWVINTDGSGVAVEKLPSVQAPTDEPLPPAFLGQGGTTWSRSSIPN
jgi:hypothetical protein